MRAIVCTAWGDPDSLTLQELPDPQPGPGQVAIDVHACGLNFADTLMITGKYQVRPDFPFSPGLEIAGIIAALGEGVDTVTVGERVIGVVSYGGFAEKAVADISSVYAIPDNLSYPEAAGFPVAYGSSHLALTDVADLQPGQFLVVFGAAGGVGLTAVEIGKMMGATVIAVASGEEKMQVVRDYGADHVIDYRAEDIRARIKELTDGRGGDVFYDPVGGDMFEAALKSTAMGAKIIVVGFASGTVPQIPANYLLIKNITVHGYFWGGYRAYKPQAMRDSMEQLLVWAGEGKLKPHIAHTFPLEQAADALKMLTGRKSMGKTVVTVR